MRTCYITDKGEEIEVEDESKFADQPTLRWGDYPVLSKWPSVVTIVLINERRRQESFCENDAVQERLVWSCWL